MEYTVQHGDKEFFASPGDDGMFLTIRLGGRPQTILLTVPEAWELARALITFACDQVEQGKCEVVRITPS